MSGLSPRPRPGLRTDPLHPPRKGVSPVRLEDRSVESFPPVSSPTRQPCPARIMSPIVVACYQCASAVNILPMAQFYLDTPDDPAGIRQPEIDPLVEYWVLDVGWLIWGVEIWMPA